MTELSSAEIAAISANPSGDGLTSFRRLYPGDAATNVIDNSDASGKRIVLELISAILGQTAALILPSRNGDGPLGGDLVAISIQFSSGRIDYNQAIPLLRLVIDGAADTAIWTAVYELVAHTRETTPFEIPKPRFDRFETPLRPNSAGHMGSSQIHNVVDSRLMEELDGRIYEKTGGFFERFFAGRPWYGNTEADYKRLEQACLVTDSRWTTWPQPPSQDKFIAWFNTVQDGLLPDGRRYYTSTENPLKNSSARRRPNIFLGPPNATLVNGEYDWSEVLAVGELKESTGWNLLAKTLVQLADFVRQVFASQPDRRFVPAFTICDNLMRLYMFDRSGVYSAEVFNIEDEPERFSRVIAGYARMTESELGLTTTIKSDKNGKYVIARHCNTEVKIYLEDKPIAWQKAIVCRGTTCFRGKRKGSKFWEFVVKFSWQSDMRESEGSLLQLAKEKGVEYVAEWVDHQEIVVDGVKDNIASLRTGLVFGKPRGRLSNASRWSLGYGHSLTSSRLLKSSTASSKRSSLTAQSSTLSAGQKRKASADVQQVNSTKRSRFSSESTERNSPAEVSIALGSGLPASGNGTDKSSHPFENRVHSCLVVKPAGRPIYDFHSVTELLEALRDSIKGHQSLLQKAEILHRDISENNIIITGAQLTNDPKGLLIDLDLAKRLGSGHSRARHRTGTIEFMAIEVLENRVGHEHSYRHDLESFFYVFLWMCIVHGHKANTKDKPTTEFVNTADIILSGWCFGTYESIASTKRGHMAKKKFEDLLSAFPLPMQGLRGLARHLRSVLFPIKDEDIFIGPFPDSRQSKIYTKIVTAFDETIEESR